MHETIPALGESQQEIINVFEREQMMKTPPSTPKKAQTAPWAPKKPEIEQSDDEKYAAFVELHKKVSIMLLDGIPENMSWGDIQYYSEQR
jgi:hypothetical protein